MCHKPKFKFGPTVPAGAGRHGGSHSSHSSSSSKSAVVAPVTDPAPGWGGSGG